jgi:Holliday junction DNA helicase RuvA
LREESINMIGRLRGTLIHKQPPWLMIDVGGVGYELEAPMSTFYDLPEVGREVTLFVHHAVKEDAVALYGFFHERERRLFRDVQKVTGIGAKIALAILSGISVDGFVRCVQARDTATLTQVPGIGRKTAERLILDLRERVDAMAAEGIGVGASPPVAAADGSPETEVVDALLALGYRPAEARRMVEQARPEAGGASTAELLRAALKAAAQQGRG